MINASTLQVSIEVWATLAFALSGLIAGARKKLDPFGVFVVTGVAAFGGGTLRDVLLDRRPFFWVEHANWLWLLLLMCMLAMIFMRSRHIPLTERAILIPDALGLGLFTALGTQITLNLDMPVIVCALMGVMTAVFGGVLRDIFCNEIPKAFNDHQPYAVIAFSGSLLVVILNTIHWPT
ncbi:MAG: TRIC cation channel family protein, partial [Methylotenera sp.]